MFKLASTKRFTIQIWSGNSVSIPLKQQIFYRYTNIYIYIHTHTHSVYTQTDKKCSGNIRSAKLSAQERKNASRVYDEIYCIFCRV